MAYARGSEAYDYNRINAGTSAAPKRSPAASPKAAPRPKVVKKTRAQLRAEQRRSTAKTIEVLLVCAVMFSLVAFQIFSHVRADELDRELKSINSEISVLESENTRLNMQLDAIISLDKVDKYAQDVLGMVKVENYQVSYVDLSGDDSVEVSGGKNYRSLFETIKAYFK